MPYPLFLRQILLFIRLIPGTDLDQVSSFTASDPVVQKPHLLFRVKPMLAAFHDGEHGAILFRKVADSFKWRQVVAAPIED